MSKPFTPRDYQLLAIDWLTSNAKAALWATPGTGKTVSALTALDNKMFFGEAHRALIVVPKRVMDVGVWAKETHKWQHLHVTPVNIVGTPLKREAIVKQGDTINVINFELLPWLMKRYEANWPWDVVIIDEASKLKSHDTVLFRGKPKVQPGLKQLSPRIKTLWQLTGTPGDLLGLWAPLFTLDQGARLGKNITAFRQRWFRQGYDGFSWQPLPHAESEILPRVEDLCLTIKAQDYMSLPDLVQNIVSVQLPQAAMTTYKTLEREFFVKLEDDIVEAANAAVLSGKLLQASSGFLYHPETNETWEELHDAKLDALADLVAEISDPVVVAYHYRADATRIKNRFKHAIEFDGKQATINKFAEGKIPMLLLHPASAGHGIDGLQDGSNQFIWFGLTWSLEHHDQAIERIGPTRQKQSGHERNVFVHYLVADGTVDNLVMERLIEKKTVQEIILNHMRKTNV